jgi:hypothetical protein
MAENSTNTAKKVEGRLPLTSLLWIIRILIVTSLVPFESDHVVKY